MPSILSFSPVAGIQLLATLEISRHVFSAVCFSPVAGIQLLATLDVHSFWTLPVRFQSRCRDSIIGDTFPVKQAAQLLEGFSPVAGIQLLATQNRG